MTEQVRDGIVPRNVLSEAELEAIRQLAVACNHFDKIDLKLNWDLLRSRPGERTDDFLYYQAGELVGYLAMYQFNSWEVEISGMVRPEHRRKGIFSELLAAAKQKLEKRGQPNLIFIVSESSQSGKAFALSAGAKYTSSEYKMERCGKAPLPKVGETLRIREAVQEDVEALGRMAHVCFGLPLEEMVKRAQKEFHQPNYRLLVAELDGERVGRINIDHPEPGLAWLFGYCVLPEYRGKGYGRELLVRTIQRYLAQGYDKFELEVAVENKRAIRLYESCGFAVTSGYDYYLLSGN
jgi:ribosomal protein S18 acetylase RimI-like enzyme